MGGGVIVSQRQHIQKPDTGQGSAGCQRLGLGNGFPVHGEVGEGNIFGADEDVAAGAAESTVAMPVLVTALETGVTMASYLTETECLAASPAPDI